MNRRLPSKTSSNVMVACLYSTVLYGRDVTPTHDCQNPATLRVVGDAEREDAYICQDHEAWIRNELRWVPKLVIVPMVAALPEPVECAGCGWDGTLIHDKCPCCKLPKWYCEDCYTTSGVPFNCADCARPTN